MDCTGKYGAAFYSCAVGMGLSAICLAMVGQAKSGICRSTKADVNSVVEKEKAPQDSDQTDFLEVDLAPEDSPLKTGGESGPHPC